MHGRAPNRSDTHETQRYKTAAAAALDQLDWVIDYLNRSQKTRLAAAMKRNRDNIAGRLR